MFLVNGIDLDHFFDLAFIVSGSVILVLMTSYLTMWILLKVKTNRRDITSIERIGKIYCYVSSVLEIMAMFALLYDLLAHIFYRKIYSFLPDLLFGSIDIVMVCLQIHGIRLEKNKLLGIYLVFRYAYFFLDIGVILSIFKMELNMLFTWCVFIGVVLFYVFDIGLTVILHSIRENRRKSVGMENPLNDFE